MSSTALFAPDGSVRLVPQNQVSAALNSGGETAVQMRAPDGSKRYVRQSQVGAAQQAGGSLVSWDYETPKVKWDQPTTLAQMIRAKYPGAYDDMDDVTLEKNVLAKYPQYADLPRTDPYSNLDEIQKQSMQQAQGERLNYFDQNMHGVLPFPVASPATNRAFDAQWNSRANPVTHLAGGYVGPEVPKGMEDAANVAEKLPQVAGAAAAVPFAGAFPLKAAGGVVGAAGASALGKILFRNASPEAQAMASDVGGMAGGTAGTVVAPDDLPELPKASELLNRIASVVRDPATARQSQIGKPGNVRPVLPSFLQKYTVPDWIFPKGDVGTPTNPGWFADLPAKIRPPEPELGSPDNPGWVVKLPNTMPGDEEPEAELGSPQNPGPYSKLPNRLTRAQIDALNEQKTSTLPRSTVPGVNVIPEPRTPFDEEVPNYMASVPRNDLSKLAKAGKPGAGKQLQQLGKTVIYAPPSGYAGEDFQDLRTRLQSSGALGPPRGGAYPGEVVTTPNGDRWAWSGRNWAWVRNDANQ